MTTPDPLIARLDALAQKANRESWELSVPCQEDADFIAALVTAWPEIRTRLEAASPQALAEYEARRDKGLAVIRAEKAERERDAALADVARMRAALGLIAAPKRPDGTYNRGREACEQIARAALKGETT